MSTMV